MGKRARWILFGVVLLAAIGFGWAKLHRGPEPIARWTLPDGTELRLEQVTYGTHHVMPGAGRLVSWLTAKASVLPHSRIPYLKAEYTRDTAAPCPVLWFTCRDPKTGKFVSTPEMRMHSVWRGYSPGNSDWYENSWEPFPNTLYEVRSYDRRKPTFRMRMEVQDKTFEFDVKNPVAGAVFPEWKPEPLPQTQTRGDFAFILRSIELTGFDNGAPEAVTDFELLEAGKSASEIMVHVLFLDATGNITREDPSVDILPLTESAWKVQATFFAPKGDPVKIATVEFIVAPPKVPGEGKSWAVWCGVGGWVGLGDGCWVAGGEPFGGREMRGGGEKNRPGGVFWPGGRRKTVPVGSAALRG